MARRVPEGAYIRGALCILFINKPTPQSTAEKGGAYFQEAAVHVT